METVRLRAPRPLLWIVFSALAILATSGAVLFFSGCAAPAPIAAAAAPPAHLVVINETDYLWHLVIVRASGGAAQDARLEPRATATLDLAGGDYVIEQTALSDGVMTELTRKIPAKLDSGQSYRWRLVTLLSDSIPSTGSK